MNARRWIRLACLCADVLSGTVLAQTASPGTETALRRSIAEIVAGSRDYGQMTPEWGNAARQQLSDMQSLFGSWGEVKSVAFKGVGPMGADIYDVTFEKGPAEFLIDLTPDGKIAREGVHPMGALAPSPGMGGLPEEGAPKAKAGPYQVAVEPAFGALGLKTFRPESLDHLSRRDRLPLVVWGNGGCSVDSPEYAGLLFTIASHGFLVITTTAGTSEVGAAFRQASADDLKAGIDWAEAENTREGSPLKGKIETKRVAVMGTSCGGALAITLGADSRVRTIGVFNFGVVRSPDAPPPPPFYPNVDALKKLHGPILLINGHERDFLMAASKATYDAVENVPAFYGARHGAGHLGTFSHPGGGEFANVATQWALWQLKGDRKARTMFVGTTCTLCADTNWTVDSKRLAK